VRYNLNCVESAVKLQPINLLVKIIALCCLWYFDTECRLIDRKGMRTLEIPFH